MTCHFCDEPISFLSRVLQRVIYGPCDMCMRSEAPYLLKAALDSPELTEKEKNVVKILGVHRGASSAITSRQIALMLGIDDGSEKPRRWIASTVETLVLLHHLPIGGSRVPPYGYFLIETQADLDLAINARFKEVYAHLRYLRALTSKQDVARLFGQAQLQLDSEVSR